MIVLCPQTQEELRVAILAKCQTEVLNLYDFDAIERAIAQASTIDSVPFLERLVEGDFEDNFLLVEEERILALAGWLNFPLSEKLSEYPVYRNLSG
jgi:hypothetical protein